MKFIERFAKISYWITIIFIFFLFVLMPIIFINVPDSFEKFSANSGRNPYNLTLSTISFAVIFLWGYCLWFWYKNDKYSKSIFLLLLFNWFYAPIYYYRVKIKKRPLQNGIEKAEKKEEKGIDEREFIELTRKNIISVLQLWTSKEKQFEYQKLFQETQVSSDLFEQWNDFYTPTAEVMKHAFDKNELYLLEKFDKIITKKAKDLNNSIPDLNEFIETSEWKELNLLSGKILTDLK